MEIRSYLNLNDALACMRREGLKKAWKTYRWRLVSAVFLIYLIRDLVLYVLIPYYISQFL